MAIGTNPFSSGLYDPYSDQVRQMEHMRRMYEESRKRQYGELAKAEASAQAVAKQDPTPDPVLLLTGEDE